MKNKSILAEMAGWYGALAILTAYILVSFGIIAPEGLIYQILNLTGALGVVIIAIHKNVKQSVLLNIFWASVAIIAIVKIVFG